MFAATRIRLETSISEILRFFAAKKPSNRGPMPTWINDPQLAEKLLKDTGLTPEDLGGRAARNGRAPTLTQQNFW